MHDNFGGEPPKFAVNEPQMAVDYMKPEHCILPKSKPAKSQPPLKELNKLVETIKTEPTTKKTEVEVLEESKIPQDSGTGTYQYSSLDEILKSVIHVRSTRPWWTDWNLKKKIVTMYSYIARPPVAQSFVISMITTIITMNVKDRVTPGSPRTELTWWCVNVEWLPHCLWLNHKQIMAKCICHAVNIIVSYSLGGDLNPTRGQCKFLRMDVNDLFQD